MSSPKDIASSFTISGLMDSSSKTRKNYPILEIAAEDIADHPENVAYSMDEKGIESLAESIRDQGLTDLPLVRKKKDGTFEMVSGHRRKAAYMLLAKGDGRFAKLPCRVIEGLGDDASVAMLHAANYFTRSLSVTERAAATRALGIEVERRRAEDESLSGVRTEDIKASIIEEQTGRKVSGRTILRQEAIANLIETRLIDSWREKADAGKLSVSCIESIAELSEADQILLYDNLPDGCEGKSEITGYVTDVMNRKKDAAKEHTRRLELELAMELKTGSHSDRRLRLAIDMLRSYMEKPPSTPPEADFRASEILRVLSDHLPKPDTKPQKKGKGRLRRE